MQEKLALENVQLADIADKAELAGILVLKTGSSW